jgi:transcriptional accessory protein Tex/SPT6
LVVHVITADEVVIELAATFEELSAVRVVNEKLLETCTAPPASTERIRYVTPGFRFVSVRE